MQLVYRETGKPVRVGDRGVTSTGQEYEVTGIQLPRTEVSTGRVTLQFKTYAAPFYPGVIGAHWTVR